MTKGEKLKIITIKINVLMIEFWIFVLLITAFSVWFSLLFVPLIFLTPFIFIPKCQKIEQLGEKLRKLYDYTNYEDDYTIFTSWYKFLSYLTVIFVPLIAVALRTTTI